MLQAMLKGGKEIIPALLTQQELTCFRKQKENFYCPICKEKVILRAGEKVIAHFAHMKDANCPSARGGEGVYHEQGKLLLFRWLFQQGIDVHLEPYLPKIKQRPDLFLHLKTRDIAIEFQCSRISNDIIIQRTNGYLEAGIHVIWILGERLLRRRGSNLIRMDSFSQTMMHQFSKDYPLSLFYFCPLTSKVIKFQDIIFTKNTQAIGEITIMPLDQITFPDLLASTYLSKELVIAKWQKEKERFRTYRRGRAFGDELKWRKWLYQKRIHFEQLSGLVYLPVRSAYLIKFSSWNWQSRILYGAIFPKPIGAIISLKECQRILRNAVLPSHQYPLINTPLDPIHEYLTLLSSLQILEKVHDTTFIKRRKISIHQHLENALQEDFQLVRELVMKKQT